MSRSRTATRGDVNWRGCATDAGASPRGIQLFNTFNWVDPGSNENSGGVTANFNSGTFGRITTQAGDPRIIQLGIKYAF